MVARGGGGLESAAQKAILLDKKHLLYYNSLKKMRKL